MSETTELAELAEVAAATPPAAPTSSELDSPSPASESASLLPSELGAMRATLAAVVQRVDQMGRLLQTVTAELQETNQQLLAAVELNEKLASESDEKLERLDVVAAALAQAEQRLTALASKS